MKRCGGCGNCFQRLGTHWQMSDCSYPEISNFQHDVITGILMGDGTVDLGEGHKNPRFSVQMVNNNYLEYIDSLFGNISTGVREVGIATSAGNKVYRLQTRRHPELHEYWNWYSSGVKIWPDDLELTPTVMRHWFCCDGHYDTNNGHRRLNIGMLNEVGNKDKINSYLSEVGLPEPTRWGNHTANWGVIETEQIFEYMGNAVPGFEYKWPSEKVKY
jgi:hypothetical protein